MPELPEVEVLVRHLAPRLRGRRIRAVDIRRPKVLQPTAPADLVTAIQGTIIMGVRRRGKYLLFDLARSGCQIELVGHLGMAGRLYLQPAGAALPRHAAVTLNLGPDCLVYEDPRYFGRLTLDRRALARLGPEPDTAAFTLETFRAALQRSSQPIKVRLLDQSLVAGLGNIYASESLFRARIAPQLPARRLSREQAAALRRAIRDVLAAAVRAGSTVPLDWAGHGARDGLFYYGRAPGTPRGYAERLRVYGREGQPCRRCLSPIRRITQAGRSTYFCPACQRRART